jgi:hypothetical protein
MEYIHNKYIFLCLESKEKTKILVRSVTRNRRITQTGTSFSGYENSCRPTGYYRRCGIPVTDNTSFDLHKTSEQFDLPNYLTHPSKPAFNFALPRLCRTPVSVTVHTASTQTATPIQIDCPKFHYEMYVLITHHTEQNSWCALEQFVSNCLSGNSFLLWSPFDLIPFRSLGSCLSSVHRSWGLREELVKRYFQCGNPNENKFAGR